MVMNAGSRPGIRVNEVVSGVSVGGSLSTSFAMVYWTVCETAGSTVIVESTHLLKAGVAMVSWSAPGRV